MSADLRTLAAEAMRGHAVRTFQEAADAVLAAVLPEHRRMVLAEATEKFRRDAHRWTGRRGHLINGDIPEQFTKGVLWAADYLAAVAPPPGPGSPEPAQSAPAVPKEADGQRAGEGDALHAPDDVYRLIAADRAARWDYVHTLPPEDLAAYIRTQSLDRNLREDADTVWWAARSRYGNQRDRALAAHEEEFERANRLATQVAQCQRVVEAAKAWRGNRYASASILELAAAVDALPDAGTQPHPTPSDAKSGTDQTEDDHD